MRCTLSHISKYVWLILLHHTGFLLFGFVVQRTGVVETGINGWVTATCCTLWMQNESLFPDAIHTKIQWRTTKLMNYTSCIV